LKKDGKGGSIDAEELAVRAANPFELRSEIQMNLEMELSPRFLDRIRSNDSIRRPIQHLLSTPVDLQTPPD
jgi:hypothetical protein